MPAVPALIMGGASIGSSVIGGLFGKSAAKSAATPSPQEQAAIDSQTALTKQQTSQGAQMFGQAMPAIQNTMGYYNTLLNGNRSQRQAATSGEAQDVASSYAGANKLIGREYVTGGEKSTALAENARASAGQIARLTSGVRPGAAQGLSGMAQGLVGAGQGLYAGASAGNANMLSNATTRQMNANQMGSQAAGNFGGLFARLMSTIGKGGGGGSDSGGGGFFQSPDDWAIPG